MNWYRFAQQNKSEFVSDKQGNPITWYHGTKADFKKFDPAYTTGQMGFHFGNEEQANSIYDEEEVPYVHQAHLTVKNPLRLTDTGAWYGEEVVNMVNETIGTKLRPSASDRQIAQAIRNAGYDGIVYENRFEGDGDSYIVFSPEQIHIIR